MSLERNTGTVTLILARHGRTALNTEGRFRGLSPVPLDAVGIQQAGRLAGRLRELCGPQGMLPRPREVWTSPRPRAIDTARPIALSLGVPSRVIEELADMNYGDWQGLTLAEAEARDPELFARWRRDPRNVVVPRGESLGNMQRRVVGVVQACLRESRLGDCWVLMAHDVVWRAFLCWALDLPLTSRDQFWQDPAAFNIVEVPLDLSSPPTIVTLNERAHLQGLLDTTSA